MKVDIVHGSGETEKNGKINGDTEISAKSFHHTDAETRKKLPESPEPQRGFARMIADRENPILTLPQTGS
jgi:hypothetical protein